MRTSYCPRVARTTGPVCKALVVAFATATPSLLLAQSADAIVEKLVQKGILTADEARELKDEANKGFKTAYAQKSGLPDWVSSFKVNGDFRGRYDGIFQSPGNYGPSAAPAANSYATEDRTQIRYRLRLGFVATMADHFEVGLRLGSGQVGSTLGPLGTGGGIFSQNQTLGGDGTAKYLFVDNAYAKWTPNEHAMVQFGKFDNLIWFSDALVDPDYQPEGGQERVSARIGEKHELGATAAQWVIAENYAGSTPGIANNDVYLFLNQIDLRSQWTKKASSRVAVGNYAFKNQNAMNPDIERIIGKSQNGTPAVNIPGSLSGAQHFNPIVARGEFTYRLDSFPLFEGEFPVTLGAEYFVNPGANAAPFAGKAYSGRANEGYNLGLVLGSSKRKHNWQVSYNFKTIESAAAWRGIIDDDFGFNALGGTDVRGHLVRGSYRLFDAMSFGVSFFHTEQIANPTGTQAKQDRVFADVLWSF